MGDYTHYDDVRSGGEDFENHVTHFYPHLGDKLIIGKFCSIAKGVEFIINGANHQVDEISAFPFGIFIENKPTIPNDLVPHKGDTVIGNDVWIGQNVTFMPSVKLEDECIIGANAVAAKDKPPYIIAVDNPTRVMKRRFDDKTIERLLKFKCWDIPFETIEENFELLQDKNIERFLSKFGKENVI